MAQFGLLLTLNFIAHAPVTLCGGVCVCLLRSADHNSSAKKHQCEGIHKGSHSDTVIIAQIRGQGRRNLSFSIKKKKIKNKTKNHSSLGVMVLKSLGRTRASASLFCVPRKFFSIIFGESCQYKPHVFGSHPFIFSPRPI